MTDLNEQPDGIQRNIEVQRQVKFESLLKTLSSIWFMSHVVGVSVIANHQKYREADVLGR